MLATAQNLLCNLGVIMANICAVEFAEVCETTQPELAYQ